ncbi:unnamed protein product [Durusdinium trenchii]|uniref:Uncharacterized protein n=1 Tax=Durusdinium trenchii TaxID=1381693 RepID=A0ABP0QZS3_9DINO
MDGPKLDLSSVQMSAKPDARLIDGNVPPPPAKPDAELIEDTLPMPEFFNWCSLAATPDDDGKRSPRPSFFDTNFLLLGQVFFAVNLGPLPVDTWLTFLG